MGGESWYVAVHRAASPQVTPSAVAGPFGDQLQAAALAEWISEQYPSCRAAPVAADPSSERVLFADAPRFPGTTIGLQEAVATCGLNDGA